MSKARSRGKIRPNNDPQAPISGTKGYLRVLSRGCSGGKYPDTPNGAGEYYCGDDYGWPCDDCPIVVEQAFDDEAKWVYAILTMQGPPRDFKHPMEFWATPTVATELYWTMSNEDIKAAVERYNMVTSLLPDRGDGDLQETEGWVRLFRLEG